ncbi:MAG: 6-carboxytetrahydropterin synthase, partial [Bdellovibrionota bacterium]
MKFRLKQHFQIESARFLRNLPENHPCHRMHGHSFKIILSFITEQDPKTGWGLDYHVIQKEMAPLLLELDHRVLNEVKGLENPTSENLAVWIYDR